MAIALQADSLLADAFNRVAERLRQSTVQVTGTRGPGGGSGVIWQPDGVIVTNAHVARGSEAIVTLADGRTFDATVTARDDGRDLAALKVDAGDLPAAAIGDSDALRVGELVIAVGNPLGLAGAVTAGVVHAIGGGEGPRQRPWVRADVRLAPGNSGGPLADAQGRVVGINSMIAGGLALAVPSNAVRRFLQRGAARPYLGVTTQPVQAALAGQPIFGLLVMDVADGSPAEGAGLIPGDVLIGTDGVLFRGPDSLIRALFTTAPGESMALDILRGGQRTLVRVQIGECAPERQAA